MKKAIFLIVFVFSIAVNAQKQDEELMYMVLENFTYQPNTSKFKFDLVIKNNSDKTLYFIKPKNYFFGNHSDKDEKASEYGLYYSKPYYVSITPYKDCTTLEAVKDATMNTNDTKEAVEVVEIEELEEPVEVVAEAAVNADAIKDDKLEQEETIIEYTEAAGEAVAEATATVSDDYKAFKMIDEIIEIPAREYRKFKNIEIDRNYGVFCSDVTYKMTVDYYSSFNPFDYYSETTYKDYLKNNNSEAINTAFENEFKFLKKDGVNNTENLKNILKLYDGLLKTNYTKFYSNTIENN